MNQTMKTITAALIAAIAAQSAALANVGFGSRKETPPPLTEAPSTSPAVTRMQGPPETTGTEWVRVPFDQAENEVLALLQRDLPKFDPETWVAA